MRRNFIGAVFLLAFLFLLPKWISAEVPADNSPEETYQRYTVAVVSDNLGEMLRYLAMDKCAEWQKKSSEDQNSTFQALRSMTPQNQTIPRKEAIGEQVILYPQGMIPDLSLKRMRTTYGRVVLVKEYGRWRILDILWQTKPFKNSESR